MPGTYLKLGEWNALCDICKFKFKSSELKLNWRGQRVCKDDWEARNIQDFIKVRAELGAAPWVRPRGNDDLFVDACTIEGSSAMPAYAIPGCMIPGREYHISRDSIPSFCTINSVQALADIGAADCATLGFI